MTTWRIRLMLAFVMVFAFSPGRATAQNSQEGKKIYLSYCVGCHGELGKGDGMAAQSFPTRPADHTNGAVMNRLTDRYLIDIITKGGSALGKSSFMPAWGNALNDKQIRDLVAYLRSIAEPPYKRDEGAK